MTSKFVEAAGVGMFFLGILMLVGHIEWADQTGQSFDLVIAGAAWVLIVLGALLIYCIEGE